MLPWATSTITDPKPVSWRYVVSLLRLFFKNKIYSVATILDFGEHVPNINQYYYLFFVGVVVGFGLVFGPWSWFLDLLASPSLEQRSFFTILFLFFYFFVLFGFVVFHFTL